MGPMPRHQMQNPQKEMEKLYNEFKAEGFDLLAFPSNDFGNQEPLKGEAIQEFCEINFNTTFPIFEKIKVKGKKGHELFRFFGDKKENGNISSPPRWNFQKYLINKEGEVVNYFYSFTTPTSSRIKKAIRKLL